MKIQVERIGYIKKRIGGFYEEKDEGSKGPESVTTTKVSVTTGGNSTSNSTQNSSKVDTKIPKTKIKKLPAKKKSSDKVKITLKKVSGIKGYQIKVSISKKFSSSKKKTVTKNVKKQNATIKRKIFKGKKKLYVKARAYKLVNGKKKYGAWSKIKKVNIKKYLKKSETGNPSHFFFRYFS